MLRPLLLVCALALAACAATPELPGPAARGDRAPAVKLPAPDLSAYKLGIGDKIRIDVFNEADLTLEATVDPTGHISYPLLGSVDALRKTAAQMQDTITAGLSAGYLKNPDVRVTVVQYRAIYVTGQVQRPGAYPFIIGLTVEKALALAGGMTNLASVRRIYVLHEDQPAEQRARVEMGAQVAPGDTLLVEESLF